MSYDFMMSDLGVYDNIQIKEIEECKFVTKCKSTYDVDKNIFTLNEMNELKRIKLALIDRKMKGCYRCKIGHTKLYKEMIGTYVPYIQKLC